MNKACNNCTEVKENVLVPLIVHESEVARQERHVKRMWIALIVAVAMLFFSNMAWIGAWTSYDYSSEEIVYQQDGEGTNIIGDGNEVSNGAKDDYSQEEAS